MEKSSTSAPRIAVRCCIVGAGPAGMMLGYLLGRAGVDTLVLEKHADYRTRAGAGGQTGTCPFAGNG